MKYAYEYLIVGSGLFGAVFAHEMRKRGKRVLVLERRNHIGGNIYSEKISGIDVHTYGPHIFHTNKREIWQYVNDFVFFRPFVYAPLACYKGAFYNLPFNMHTFYQLWGVKTPREAQEKLLQERAPYQKDRLKNLEEQALQLIGPTIYERLIQGYTEKQWGRKCSELPAFIIRRLPLRMSFDNNYFDDVFQGIPVDGYAALIQAMLAGIEVRLETDFLRERSRWAETAEKIVFTGPIDAYFSYRFGALEYRSLRFETEVLAMDNYQGVAVVNYTEATVPYTRITEHKHFLKTKAQSTVITREYPQPWTLEREPFYPINDARNNALYEKYRMESKLCDKVRFGGRLGTYRYYNMDQVVEQALLAVQEEDKR